VLHTVWRPRVTLRVDSFILGLLALTASAAGAQPAVKIQTLPGASAPVNRLSVQAAADESPITFVRLPAENDYGYLVPMDGPADRQTAYFRDAATGGEIFAVASHDGQTWHAEATRPDGTTTAWRPITFHTFYFGRANCFVDEYGYGSCGSTFALMTFYDYTQCGPVGTWQMRFYRDNAQFASGAYVLLPRVPDLGTSPPTPWAPTGPAGTVPSYSQVYEAWHFEPYDGLCTVWNPTTSKKVRDLICPRNQPEPEQTPPLYAFRSPIGSRGCLLTAAVDLLGYHGVQVTPDAFDRWLVGHDGYLPGGDLKTASIALYAAASGKTLSWQGDWGAEGGYPNSLESTLCLYGPQLIEARPKRTPTPGPSPSPGPAPTAMPAHWALATGYTDNGLSNIWMADPGRLKGGAPPYQSGPFSTLDPYRPLAELTTARTKVFQGGAKALRDHSGIYIIFHSPVQFVVTDASGRQTGYDVASGRYLADIPSAGYSDGGVPDADGGEDPDPPKVFEMPRPPAGDYSFAATGTADGTYSLDVWLDNAAGTTSKMPTMTDVAIRKGETHHFLLPYALGAAPKLTGGFDGGGQRPRDVNRFLSYVSPSASRTVLPAGATSFSIIVSYGPTTSPDTFEAVLNGASVAALFHPSPGTMETVSVPVVPGTNVLKLAISGTAGTRLATDSDRLVLDVP
jgi:hypothetical protein